MERRACQHCHTFFKPLRNPQQRFCSRRVCQNARKAIWRRARLKKDPDYRENQQHACQRWRGRNPVYWKQYRASHPHYTEKNRENQRIHQQKLRLCNKASQFANSDALTANNPLKAGRYQMIPVAYNEFANSDALIVEISVIARGSEQMGEVCKHTTL
jgi:hypothetical protein